jgi:undecaprenol kinase
MSSLKNQRFFVRLRFAIAGFVHCFHTERSLRTQVLAFLSVVIALLILRPAPVWWGLAILASVVTLAAELFNAALEKLADHLHPQLHPQIRIVKDYAAAAVLCVALGATGIAIALVVEIFRH